MREIVDRTTESRGRARIQNPDESGEFFFVLRPGNPDVGKGAVQWPVQVTSTR